jgi:hypothetical protein
MLKYIAEYVCRERALCVVIPFVIFNTCSKIKLKLISYHALELNLLLSLTFLNLWLTHKCDESLLTNKK